MFKAKNYFIFRINILKLYSIPGIIRDSWEYSSLQGLLGALPWLP